MPSGPTRLSGTWRVALACGPPVLAALFVLPFSPDSFEGPKRLVWGALAVALAAGGLLRRRSSSVASRAFFVSATALLAWMFLRTLPAAPFWRVAAPLAAWATPPLLLVLASRLPWNDTSRAALFRTLAFLGLAEAALMLLQRFGLDPVFGEATRAIPYAPARMIGTVGYQNQAAEFLGVALCCIPAAWKNRRLRLAAILFLGASVALTANRGALLSLAVVGVVAASVRLARRRPPANERERCGRPFRAFLLLLLCASLVAAAPELRSRFGEIALPSRSVAVQSRAWMARVALSLWRDHPFLGSGAGGYAHEYVDRLGALLPARKEHGQLRALVWAREAHCDPLQFVAEFGLAGGLLALAFLLTLIPLLRRSPGAGPAAAACVFLSCCSLFSFSWQTSLAAPMAGLLLGVTAGRSGEDPPLPRSASRAARLPTAFASVALALAAAFSLFVPAMETAEDLRLEACCREFVDRGTLPDLHGRRLADCATFALRRGRPVLAAELCARAADDWTSPDLLLVRACALDGAGRPDDAIEAWSRLERSGLRNEEALRGLSRSLERAGRIREAAGADAERFRLWASDFSDAELYRLCALMTMSGGADCAERLSRKFQRRARLRNEAAVKWTAEWANLRGSALLALGRREEARECFEEALRRKPELDSARRNLNALSNP